MWIVTAVESSIGWPSSNVSVEYQRRKFLLRPEAIEHYADVVLHIDNKCDPVEIESEIRRFLSVLSWAKNGSAAIVSSELSTSESPRRIPRKPRVELGKFPSLSLTSRTPEVRLMLGLYREAISVNSPLFAFFGFFKILNTRYAGDDQQHWISCNLHRLKDPAAVERASELGQKGIDVGSHIYRDIRTAIIHASERHNVDPDETTAVASLSRDLPLMKALAELFIEDNV